MAKRKVSPEQFRAIVLARITKGDAFRMDYASYTQSQETTKAALAAITIKDITEAYPWVTTDITTGGEKG